MYCHQYQRCHGSNISGLMIVLLCRTAKAEKKVRVNDREDTLCEPKVVECLSKKKWELQIVLQMDGVLQMEWNNLGLLLMCSS